MPAIAPEQKVVEQKMFFVFHNVCNAWISKDVVLCGTDTRIVDRLMKKAAVRSDGS